MTVLLKLSFPDVRRLSNDCLETTKSQERQISGYREYPKLERKSRHISVILLPFFDCVPQEPRCTPGSLSPALDASVCVLHMTFTHMRYHQLTCDNADREHHFTKIYSSKRTDQHTPDVPGHYLPRTRRHFPKSNGQMTIGGKESPSSFCRRRHKEQ